MDALPEVRIHPSLSPHLRGHRLHLLHFDGAAIGVGSPDLDELREKVLGRLRPVLESFRDLQRLPQIEAFQSLLRACGLDPRRRVPVHARRLREVARREPFPVRDDVRDAVLLCSLEERVPVFVVDASGVASPLSLTPAVSEEAPGRPVDGEPVLADPRGPLLGLVSGVLREEVRAVSRELLAVAWDPGVEDGVEPGRLAKRLSNWLSRLAGAELRNRASVDL